MSGDNGETRKWVNTAANVSKADSLKRMADASQARAEAALRKQLMEEERRREQKRAEHQAWLDSLIPRKKQHEIRNACYASLPEIFQSNGDGDWVVKQEYKESLKSPRQKWFEENNLDGWLGSILFGIMGLAAGFLVGVIVYAMVG